MQYLILVCSSGWLTAQMYFLSWKSPRATSFISRCHTMSFGGMWPCKQRHSVLLVILWHENCVWKCGIFRKTKVFRGRPTDRRAIVCQSMPCLHLAFKVASFLYSSITPLEQDIMTSHNVMYIILLAFWYHVSILAELNEKCQRCSSYVFQNESSRIVLNAGDQGPISESGLCANLEYAEPKIRKTSQN